MSDSHVDAWMTKRRCRVKHAASVTAEDKAAYNLVLWGTAGGFVVLQPVVSPLQFWCNLTRDSVLHARDSDEFACCGCGCGRHQLP